MLARMRISNARGYHTLPDHICLTNLPTRLPRERVQLQRPFQLRSARRAHAHRLILDVLRNTATWTRGMRRRGPSTAVRRGGELGGCDAVCACASGRATMLTRQR